MGIEILRDKESGAPVSMKRSIALVGFIIMCVAFAVQSYRGGVTAEMFLTFPLGLIVLYVPQLAITLLKIWRGNNAATGSDS